MLQDPIDGVSFAYTFDDPDAEGRLRTQYFEIMGSRAIYHDGWMASAFGPRIPWVPGLPAGIADWTPDQDVWELYNLDQDWSQAHDLADQMPDKLAQLKETFTIEAARNSVYPIGGGAVDTRSCTPSCGSRRPYREWNFTGDIIRMPEFCAPALGNRANQVTIDLDIPPDPAGVLYALGGAGGGLTCYIDDGYLCYEYNTFIVMRTKIRSDQRSFPTGTATIQVSTEYAEPRPAGPLDHHDDRQRRPGRRRPGPGQRAAAVHRQRLPRHRHLPRLPGLSRLLRPRTVPVQRPHPPRQRPLHRLVRHPPMGRDLLLSPPIVRWRCTHVPRDLSLTAGRSHPPRERQGCDERSSAT